MTAAARVGGGRPPRRHAPAPWQRNAVFGLIGATVVLGWIGDAVWASLVDRSPLTLILLNAKPRYLVLVANQLDAWVFYPVATFRLLCTKPLVWLVGAWYGHRAVDWAQQRWPRFAGLIDWVEARFRRFGWWAIAVTSNNLMCLLAGASGFSLTWFMVLAVAGTLARLYLLRVVGDVLSGPIDDLVGFVVDHRVPIVVASVAVVAGGLWLQHRSGRTTLDDLADLEHTLEDG